MKLIKKITAAVTAMALAASMMSIGASANPPSENTWPTFNLTYSCNASSPTENVTSKTLLKLSDNTTYMTVSVGGQLIVSGKLTYLTNATVTLQGWVQDYHVNNNWAYVTTVTASTTGYNYSSVGTYPYAQYGARAKVIAKLNYATSSTYSHAYGRAVAY